MAEILVRHRFSVGEYNRMGEAGILGPEARVELIDGEVVQMSPIGSRHSACVIRMAEVLQLGASGLAMVLVQGPIVLDDYWEPQPDIAVLRRQADYYASGHPAPADILLVIEVADTTLAYDLGVKAPHYAAAGIAECWVVDVGAGEIVVMSDPSPGGYGQSRRVGRGATITVAALAGRELAVEELIGPLS